MKNRTPLFLGLLSMTALAVQAQLSYITNNDTITITGVTNLVTTLSIPATINNRAVTQIAPRAFASIPFLTTVAIPTSVTNIGNEAFAGCTSLTTFTVSSPNAYYSSLNGVLFNAGQTVLVEYPGGLSGSYTIPASVTNIGINAFEDANLSGVTVPASVIGIGSQAFLNCDYLTAITVNPANSVYSSVSGVLFDYSQDTLIAFPADNTGVYGVPASVTSISPAAFAGCKLQNVTIPSSVTNIGAAAFAGSSTLSAIDLEGTNAFYASVGGVLYDVNLDTLLQYPPVRGGTTYVIPDTVTNIAYGAFNYDTAMRYITIPSGVTSLGDFAFQGCTGLTNISILGNIARIGTNAFNFCLKLPAISLPDSITNIADYAFGYCLTLGAITLPNGVGSIGQEAFYECGSLTNAALPNAVDRIGAGAFYSCSNLSNITLPGTVTNLGSDAFAYCPKLTLAYFLGNAPVADTTVFTGTTNTTVYYFAGTTGWGTNFGGLPATLFPFTWSTNEGAATITGYTGSNGKVIIPPLLATLPVTAIGNNAFASNTILSSITIPASVTNIGNEALAGCLELATLTVSPQNAFYSSTNNILFDKAKTILLQYPFNLFGIYTFPASVVSIGNGAFMHSPVEILTYSPNLASIGAAAFAYCNGFSSVTIPNTVTNIGDEAFYDCSGMTSITIKNGTIGNEAFANCSSITTVTLGDGVTSIGTNAFYGLNALAAINIPGSVSSIGNAAFENCRSLTSLTLGNGIASIGTNAFYDCRDLRLINVPSSVTNIGAGAFTDIGFSVSIYFTGNAPAADSVFSPIGGTVYYFPGTSGWGSTFGGAPTQLWNPLIQTSDGSFGVQTNEFGFNVTAATNLTVVLESCTNLANPVWQVLRTNQLVNGTAYFSDAQWTNYPNRFYTLSPP